MILHQASVESCRFLKEHKKFPFLKPIKTVILRVLWTIPHFAFYSGFSFHMPIC